MVVSIKFFGMQRSLTKTDGIDMPITERTRAHDAIEYVRHEYPVLRLEEGTVLIIVNEEIASPNNVLRANDTISFLPYISGG